MKNVMCVADVVYGVIAGAFWLTWYSRRIPCLVFILVWLSERKSVVDAWLTLLVADVFRWWLGL